MARKRRLGLAIMNHRRASYEVDILYRLGAYYTRFSARSLSMEARLDTSAVALI